MPEYVYLIGSEDSPMVKIGRSTNIPARLAAIQSMSPLKLAVLWQTEGGAELEAALHRWFRSRRSHGEWFEFPDGDALAEVAEAVEEIAARTAPPPIPGLGPVGWESPLGEQVVNKLRQIIVDGELPPSGQIPTEEMLVEQFNVSRTTIRQALRSLEQEGLIRSHGGRGGRVVREDRRLAWNMLEDVDDLWAAGVEGVVEEASERDAVRLGVRPGDLVIVRRQTVLIDGKPREIADYEIPAQSRAVT